MESGLQVGPSRHMDDWHAFFHASPWRPEDFHALVAADGPGRALFTVETMINSLYWWAENARRGDHPHLDKVLEEVHAKSTWLSARSREARQALGPLQRELDLGVLRWIRRDACLSVVIGAGATMAAGGPSWPALVHRLLVRLLERLDSADEALAHRIVAAIDDGSADIELLTRGASLCHDLRGQHLFADITGVLYEDDRQPSPVHRAIAELADPITLRGGDRAGRHPGWESIISYNFDDLMGEALDARGLPRTAHVTQRVGKRMAIAGYMSEHARGAGRDEPQLEIFHLHGYTRRRPHPITDIEFVFSAAQYRKTYARRRRRGLIDHVFDRWLALPVHHALYVGCSFVDPAMNRLLADAATKLPGRYHYAILEWPGTGRFEQASVDAIAAASARYEAMGLRPIWYDRHDEIPTLLRRLA